MISYAPVNLAGITEDKISHNREEQREINQGIEVSPSDSLSQPQNSFSFQSCSTTPIRGHQAAAAENFDNIEIDYVGSGSGVQDASSYLHEFFSDPRTAEIERGYKISNVFPSTRSRSQGSITDIDCQQRISDKEFSCDLTEWSMVANPEKSHSHTSRKSTLRRHQNCVPGVLSTPDLDSVREQHLNELNSVLPVDDQSRDISSKEFFARGEGILHQ